MNTLVQIEVKSVFGSIRFYPVNHTAQIFANMLGSITLTRNDLFHIERLGYTIESQANTQWRD